MRNFREGLNEIWENKDWDNDSFFEAICELHDKIYEPLKQGEKLPIHIVSKTKSTVCNCECVETTDLRKDKNGVYSHVICGNPITN